MLSCPLSNDPPSTSPAAAAAASMTGHKRHTRDDGETRKRYDAGGEGGAEWIIKPSGLSRGRGVYLLRDLEELAYDQMSIVQRYIPDPLTVGGYKADLRL